jgi:signal transduction histidine kinase
LRTLALAESGALQLKKEPTDLALLAGETVSAFRTQADASGITLTVNAAEELPPCLVDPERIRQVLANLLANALRYTPRGGTIRIDLQMEGNEEKRTAVIRVQDNGVGIAPDILPQIFNRFYKSRDSSGTGLGLPIARHLVEAHGGAILAESQAGQGTTITVSLPVLEG